MTYNKEELKIMIDLNEKNIKARRKYYLETKDEKQKIRLLKLIIETNTEISRLKRELAAVA